MQEIINWWQHIPEDIDPVFLQWGAFQIRYYGLMYLCSFLVVYFLLRYRISKKESTVTPALLDDYMTWAIAGVLLGARLGYVFFYNFNYYLSHPAEILLPFQLIDGEIYFGISGMSYHGGLIGVIITTFLFCRKQKISPLQFTDFIVPAAPLGYMFGRIGNFLNGELYGRVTESSWGMYFSTSPAYVLRHPSQLYEAFFEGFILFVFLWPLRQKKYFDGAFLSFYLIGYGGVRYFIEYFREPDAHIGFVWGMFSLGQILCQMMLAIGLMLILLLKGRKKTKNA